MTNCYFHNLHCFHTMCFSSNIQKRLDSGPSPINDRWLKEPDPTYTLVDRVLRCWQSSYAASVKCMYMQDEIPEKDSNTLRFFLYFGY